MRTNFKLALACGAAVATLSFSHAYAADAEAPVATKNDDTARVEELVVVGAKGARGNAVISRQKIDALPGAQNIVDAIRYVPGVSVRGADASNSDPWSYGINIRGFDVNLRSSKLGQTIDDMPGFNASYYLGGAPAQKFVQNENLSRIQVNQGTAGVTSASASALGGTLAYYTRDPSEKMGGQLALTVGDDNLRRYAGVFDTGEVLGGSTRAYVSLARLEACRWVYGCSDNSGIDQWHGEAKFVTRFNDQFRLIGRLSFDRSLDDPIIEASRALLDSSNVGDGSVPSLRPHTPHNGSDVNQNWAHGWSALRNNGFGYLKLQYQPTETLKFEFAPYWHAQRGMGFFVPPYQQIAINQTGGVNVRTIAGGTATGSIRRRAYYGIAIAGRQRAVIPGLTYTDIDGQVISSSLCYAGGTAYASNGVASFAGMNNPNCVPLQTWRTSLYRHDRYGFTSKVDAVVGVNTIEAGVWYERLDRDFGRAWRQIIDVTSGSGAWYKKRQLTDFQQHFKTDQWKLHLQDTANLGDLTLTGGVQLFLIDIKGETEAWNAAGLPAKSLRTQLNADSNLLATVGATYKLTDDVQLFGSFAQNYGALGDWALEKVGTDTKKIKSSEAQNFETGLRYTGDRLVAGVTAYYASYDHAVTFLTKDFAGVGGSGGINYTAGTSGSYINSGKGIKSKGVEASATFAATENLDLYGALTVNESTYQSTFVGDTANAGVDQTVKAGNDVPAAPTTIASWAANWRKGPFTANLSGSWHDSMAGDATNKKALYTPAYTVWDLSAGYDMDLDGGRALSFQINVNNLTDEKYIGGILDEFTQLYMRGAPRTVSATVRAKF